jgi:L-alanine-DL-glutamate epimerase-like enolase superfamily enzyme
MKIKSIEYFRLNMPLAVPYTIVYETVTSTTNIILKLDTDQGISGWGCAAPDMEVTGETPEDVENNIKNVITGLLKDQSPFQISGTIHHLKQLISNAPSTLAMIDMALYDIMARKMKLPLYQLLGGYRHEIPTSITIGILPLNETIERAKQFQEQGFSIIKLKGGLNLYEDIEKILKLRENLGKDFVFRFDANQGYTTKETIEFFHKTESANIEFLEQPTSQKKEEWLGEVRNNIDIPVMADESIKTLDDAYRLTRNDLVDMLNIKLQKVGGILEAQHINSVVKAAGLDVMVGCIDECALGISAGLHFALSDPNIRYADLDGHLDLMEDPFADLFQLKQGTLYPSDQPGLGRINL